jgi:ABC-2 type transport system permease protein
MNIFLHELRAYRKSTIIWTVSLIGMVVLFLSIFPTFANDAKEYQRLLEGYPETVRKAIGLELDTVFTILGFYSYSLLYISLCGAIQAMNLGTSIVSKEVREKTADFLLTKPVTRSKIMTCKLLAAFSSLVITNIVFIVASILMVSQVSTEDYSGKGLFLIAFSLFLIQLIFLALGLIISVVVQKIKSVLTVSLSTVFAFFIISMLSSASGDVAKRYLSPFEYFDTAYIIKNSRYETSFLMVGIAIILISIVSSYLVYTKKDIHAV